MHLRHQLAHGARIWLRALVIVGLFALSIALAFLAQQGRLMLFAYLLAGVALVLVCLRWPPLGVGLVASVALLVPLRGPSGLNASMILVALLLGLWLLDMVVRQRVIRLAPSRVVWPAAALVVAALLSFGVGLLPWFQFALHAPLGAQLGGLSIVALSAGAFLLAANQVRHLAWLRGITWAFLAIAALFIVVRSLLPELGLPTRDLLQPLGSVFYIWLVAIAFSQAMFNTELHTSWRVALGVLVAVTLFVLVFLKFGDKSGWIPAVACVAVIIVCRSWRTGFVLAPAAVLAAIFLAPKIIATDEYSVATRIEAWAIMAEIIKTSPIWGLGFANYYSYTPLFPIRGYAVSFNSHNNYVDIAAQIGLMGLACFLLFLWEAGWLGWRLRQNAPRGFAQAYVYGALGGLAGMIVVAGLGDWVLPFFYNVGLNGFQSSVLGWLFLGGLVSLEQMQVATTR